MDIKKKKYMRRNLLLPISASHRERIVKYVDLRSKRNNSNNSLMGSNDSSMNTDIKNKSRNLSYKKIIFNPLKNISKNEEPEKKVFDNEYLKNLYTGYFEKKKLKSISSSQLLFEVKNDHLISPQKQISNNKFKSLSCDYDKKQNSENRRNSENLFHKNGQLNFVDLLLKYKIHKFVLKRGYPNIKKINLFSNKKYIQKFKENINEMIRKAGDNGKQIFLNEVHFVHQCLFNTNNQTKTLVENKSTNDIITQNNKPNYVFIDFLGQPNKYITRLSVDSSDKNVNDLNFKERKENKDSTRISDNNSENIIKKNKVAFLKSNKSKRKNLLKPIKLSKISTPQNYKNNGVKKIKKNIILEISKKGYQKLENKKKRSFDRLIDNTIEKHKKVIKKLDNIIETDKLLFEKENANIIQ